MYDICPCISTIKYQSCINNTYYNRMDKSENKTTLMEKVFTYENGIFTLNVIVGSAVGIVGGYYLYKYLNISNKNKTYEK